MGAMWERGEGEGRRESSRESSILLNMVVLLTGSESSRRELSNASCLAYVKVNCIKPSASLNDSSPLTWQPALSTAAESGWQLLCTRSRPSPSSHPQTHSRRGWEAILHTMTTHESSLIPRNWFLDQDYQPHSKGCSYQGFRLVVYDNLRSVHTCTRLAVSFAWVVDS